MANLVREKELLNIDLRKEGLLEQLEALGLCGTESTNAESINSYFIEWQNALKSRIEYRQHYIDDCQKTSTYRIEFTYDELCKQPMILEDIKTVLHAHKLTFSGFSHMADSTVIEVDCSKVLGEVLIQDYGFRKGVFRK